MVDAWLDYICAPYSTEARQWTNDMRLLKGAWLAAGGTLSMDDPALAPRPLNCLVAGVGTPDPVKLRPIRPSFPGLLEDKVIAIVADGDGDKWEYREDSESSPNSLEEHSLQWYPKGELGPWIETNRSSEQ